MRRIVCDQDEFESPSSEEALELAIARPGYQYPNLATFMLVCGASACKVQAIPAGWERWPEISDHLAKFASLTLPLPTILRETVLINDNWDDVEIAIAYDSVLLWYHWSTTA